MYTTLTYSRCIFVNVLDVFKKITEKPTYLNIKLIQALLILTTTTTKNQNKQKNLFIIAEFRWKSLRNSCRSDCKTDKDLKIFQKELISFLIALCMWKEYNKDNPEKHIYISDLQRRGSFAISLNRICAPLILALDI